MASRIIVLRNLQLRGSIRKLWHQSRLHLARRNPICSCATLKSTYFQKNSFNERQNLRFLRTTTGLHGEILSFQLSDIGEGIAEVTIKEWFVKPGDHVSQFDGICEVQSDKASVTITSRYDGTIRKIYFDVDDLAKVGEALVDIELSSTHVEKNVDQGPSPAEDVMAAQQKPKPTHAIEEPLPPPPPSLQSSTSQTMSSSTPPPAQKENPITKKGSVLATPSVRKIAMDHSISLSDVPGTGRDGRILKEDIMCYIERMKTAAAASPAPVDNLGADTTTPPFPIRRAEVRVEDITEQIKGIRKAMSKTMTTSLSIPHFCYMDEVNLDELVRLKKYSQDAFQSRSVKLTYMPMLIKATSMALLHFPILNSSVDSECENLTYKVCMEKYYHSNCLTLEKELLKLQ